MFGDALLESSPASLKNKRWPMATAFTVEAIVAAIVVVVPLLTTGVIPIAARPPIYVPIKPVQLEPVERVRTDSEAATGPARPAASSNEVVPFNNNPDAILYGKVVRTTETADPRLPNSSVGSKNPIEDLIGERDGSNVRPGPHRLISVSSEAQLLTRVEPIYPHIAIMSGIQGEVKLHAIIARDGSVQSLSVISGHPLLVRAAMEAVQQWKYRPYVLNGEKVEVETFITVHFRKETH